MSEDGILNEIPNVDIDPEGRFKYILIKICRKENSQTDASKLIVRGYARAKWHNDIFNEVVTVLKDFDLELECLGGGRIEHFPQLKKLKVFGVSTGYGKADHNESKKILQTKFADYEIEVTDEE